MMDVCYGPTVDLPTDECDECAAFLARLETIEDLLNGLERTTISATDENGDTVTLTVLAIVERS